VRRAFTPEQLDAVQRREGELLISASAGSGKTSVLVERFVRSVVDDGLAPGAVLAITFTDKAAGELRARVRAALLERGAREAARDLEGAWVLTFHGFCARVLRAHAVAAGLDPDFSVLDLAEARAARGEAFDAALADLLADRDGAPRSDALDLAAAYGVERLREMVVEVHDHLRSRGRTRPSLPRPRPADASAARAALDAACAACAAELAGARALASLDRARAALAACRELLDAGGDPDPAALGPTTGSAPPDLGRAVAELRSEACDRYRAAREAYVQALVDRAAVPALALLDELLGRYADAFAAAKRARSAVDYDDLELFVRDLLVARPEVAAGYAQRFARIMVDEFQDTNPLQLELLDALDRGNVCTVGDELQSIYGFRHADVELFRARREALGRRDATATLATSFRARPELVDAIDAAFAGAHPSWVPLVAGRADPPAAAPAPPIELLVVDADAFESEPPPGLGAGLPAAAPARQAEARLVARRVARLVAEEGFAAGDVVVLLRAATDMGLYERALELEGLATLASGGRGWWARQQVQDLCAYLGALVNPRDEAALLGLLASPLVGASSDALALLALAARGRCTLWDALHDPGLRLPEADVGRLAGFRAWFADERARAPRLALDALLARVVERTGYDLHVLTLPGGARRLANVHKLLRLAAAFEARRGRDLRGFIDLATAELEADAREPDAPVDLAGLDAVRLMTIHAAKGLEFGVVVVADLGRQGNVRQGDLLVDGDEVGLRLVGIDGSRAKALDFAAIEARRRRAEEAEERRVLHVAMTRAQERLVLSGSARLGERWPRNGPGSAALSWVGPALVPDVAELSPARPAIERRWPGRPGAVRAELVTPATLPLGGGVAAVQLELALDAPVAPREPPPARPARAPRSPAVATLSYSSLTRYAECPYRFYLERELRLPATPVPPHLRVEAARPGGIDLLLRGTLVHALLERLPPGGPLPDAEAVRALGRAHDAELADAEVQDLRALVGAFASSELSARLAGARAVHREHGFAFTLDDDRAGAPTPIVTGFVDVLALEAGGGALIVDYKSDHVAGADLDAVVEAAYGVQRRIYALAALRAGAPTVDVVHLFLERPAEPAARRYAAADLPTLRAELRARAAGLLAGEYPVAAVPHRGLCASCPARAGLCSHPPAMTDRELEQAA
jgi:ATP-dependent exoDNAse (exonuclease V) beta subunit